LPAIASHIDGMFLMVDHDTALVNQDVSGSSRS
jgi:hypothetical protein